MLCIVVRFYGFIINFELLVYIFLKGLELDFGCDLLICFVDCIRFDLWCSVFKMFEFLLIYINY